MERSDFCPTVRVGQRGRPMCDINAGQLTHLRSMGMNWTAIGNAMNISRRTLFRHRGAAMYMNHGLQ
jgi:hypothetical protein